MTSSPTLAPGDEAPTPSPSRRVAASAVSNGLQAPIWGIVAIVLLFSLALTFGLARFGSGDVDGAWTGVVSILRWICAVSGLMIVAGVRGLAHHGITRRDALRGMTLSALALIGLAAATITGGAALEWLLFAGDQRVATPVTSPTGLVVTFVVAVTVLLAYLVTGALLGMVFGTLPWGPAIALVVPCLMPAVLTEGLWAAAVGSALSLSGPVPAGVLGGVVGPGPLTGMAATAVCVASVALGYRILHRLSRYLAFPG
jgi:hypothetical protein